MITPPTPAALLENLPELASYGRTTTRLHPRPGVASATESHIGGPLLWPAAEPWPTCDVPRLADSEVPIPIELLDRLREAGKHRVQAHVMAPGESEIYDEIAEFVGPGYAGFGSFNGGPVVGRRYGPRRHRQPNPLLPLAQLRAADIPDLPRPGGADLLQVLWCPDHHSTRPNGPTVQVRWRRESDVTQPLAEMPRGEVGDDSFVPVPCRLYPEQVTEYPYPQELPDQLRRQVDRSYVNMAMAPGWKVGGYANWSLTDVGKTACPRCSGPTSLLLVIDSKEHDSGVEPRWRPADDPWPEHALEPTGVEVGRWGSLFVFICFACADTPILLVQQ